MTLRNNNRHDGPCQPENPSSTGANSPQEGVSTRNICTKRSGKGRKEVQLGGKGKIITVALARGTTERSSERTLMKEKKNVHFASKK